MANPIIQKMIKNACFNLGMLAESITYKAKNADEGKDIAAIVEIGESLAEEKAAFRGGDISANRKTSDTAVFTVLLEDVAKPEPGDVITYNGEDWKVNRINLIDSIGGNVTVEAARQVRGFGR